MTNFSSEILMLVDKRLLSSENQKKCDETLEKLIKSIKNSKENKRLVEEFLDAKDDLEYAEKIAQEMVLQDKLDFTACIGAWNRARKKYETLEKELSTAKVNLEETEIKFREMAIQGKLDCISSISDWREAAKNMKNVISQILEVNSRELADNDGQAESSITNAEKIKSLNNKELAEYLCTEGWKMGDYRECLEWLEQPAEDSFCPEKR